MKTATAKVDGIPTRVLVLHFINVTETDSGELRTRTDALVASLTTGKTRIVPALSLTFDTETPSSIDDDSVAAMLTENNELLYLVEGLLDALLTGTTAGYTINKAQQVIAKHKRK